MNIGYFSHHAQQETHIDTCRVLAWVALVTPWHRDLLMSKFHRLLGQKNRRVSARAAVSGVSFDFLKSRLLPQCCLEEIIMRH